MQSLAVFTGKALLMTKELMIKIQYTLESAKCPNSCHGGRMKMANDCYPNWTEICPWCDIRDRIIEVLRLMLSSSMPTQEELTETLAWMVTTMKWEKDQMKAPYSPELTKAAALLEELKSGIR